MYNLSRLKTVAAVAMFVAASALSTTAASANPFNPFEALFSPPQQQDPVPAPAYANPHYSRCRPQGAAGGSRRAGAAAAPAGPHCQTKALRPVMALPTIRFCIW